MLFSLRKNPIEDMQKTAGSAQDFEHKLQCDAHRSKIEFYCSAANCELRFLCFNCINLPGYHQHESKYVESINQLLFNPVDNSVLANENNFLSKCVELRNIVNSMPETVASILDMSKKVLARLKARKQSDPESISSDPRKQRLRTINNDIIQQIKCHSPGKSLDGVKASVKEALSLQNDLQKDTLWATADATLDEYMNVNHFMSISHQKLKVLAEKLDGFFVLLDKPSQSPLAKESAEKTSSMVEDSKTINKTPSSTANKTKTPRGSQLEIEIGHKQDVVMKEEQKKAILEKITVFLQNDSKISLKELEQMVAVAGPSNVELKQIYEKANILAKSFDKITKKPETLKNTVRETLSHFTPSIETSIQISLLNTIDYAFEGLEKLVTEKISGKPDINQLKLLHAEMKASKVDFSKQLEILQKAINDCETIRTKLLTVLDQAKKGKESIKVSIFTEVMLESLDLLAKPSESNNSLTIFFETLCVKCKLGFFRKAMADHKASLAIQGNERRNPFVKSFSTEEVKGVLAIVDKMWFFDFEEDEEMIFQTLKNCKQIEMQLTNLLKQNNFDTLSQMQPLIELCDQTPFSFPQIFIVMERLNNRMFLTPQDFEVKQEAESQAKDEVASNPRRSSAHRRQSIADDSELIASLSRNSKEPSGLTLFGDTNLIQPQVNIKVEEMETEKKSNDKQEVRKPEPEKTQTKQPSEPAHVQTVGFVSSKGGNRRDSLESLHRQSQSVSELKSVSMSKSSSKEGSQPHNDDEEEAKGDQVRKMVKISKTEGLAVASPQKETKEKKSKNVTHYSREQSKVKLVKSLKENPIFIQLDESELIKQSRSIELSVFDKFYLQNDSYTEKIARICEILEKLKNYKFLSQLIVKSSFNYDKLEHLEQLKEPDFVIFEKEAEKLLTGSRSEPQTDSPRNIKKVVTIPHASASNGHIEDQANAEARQAGFKCRSTANSASSSDKVESNSQPSQFRRRTQSGLASSDLKVEQKDPVPDPKTLLSKLQHLGADQVQQLANNLPENERMLVFLTLSSMAKDQNGKPLSNDSGAEAKKTP